MNISISGPVDLSIYEELQPIIENGFKKIESDPEFRLGQTRTKTIEIAVKILKHERLQTCSITLHQHRWSWLKYIACLLLPIFAGIIYQNYHFYQSTYSREKTLELVRKGIDKLIKDPNLTDSQPLSCVITAHTANHSLFSWGYWLGYKDSSTELCSYNFTKMDSKERENRFLKNDFAKK